MIIGIGGVSRSGKTYLAQLLKRKLGEAKCALIQLDDFAKPIDQLPRYHGQPDWEDPTGIDFDTMITRIKAVSTTHEHVIVEGFLVYANQQLLELIDYKIFIRIDHTTFLKRKRIDSRWGKVSEQYIEHIWQSYQKYGSVNEEIMDQVVHGKSIENLRNMNLSLPVG